MKIEYEEDNQKLVGSPTVLDEDGDSVTLTYVCKKDDVIIATGATLDVSSYINKEGTYTLEITPSDGYDNGNICADTFLLQNQPDLADACNPATQKFDDTYCVDKDV